MEDVRHSCVHQEMDDKTIGERLQAILDRQELKGSKLAAAVGFRTRSGIQPHVEREKPLPAKVARKFIKALAGTGKPPIRAEEIWALTDVPQALAEAAPPPQPWLPTPETLAELLATAMHVDDEDLEKLSELQDYASAVRTGLEWIAEDPSIESDPQRLKLVRKRVAEAIAAARSSSWQAA